MELEARGLIIYKSVEMAEEFNAALLPEIHLVDFEVRRTLLKAIQSFRETDFDICFISDSFTVDELKPFFNDLKAVRRDSPCLFIQVRDSLEEGVQRNSLESIGFKTIINHKVTDGDKASMGDLLVEVMRRQEVKRRRIDVESAMKLIMLEIDRVAKDRKRGVERQFSRDMLSGFVTDQLDFHSEVAEAYSRALDTLADKGQPMRDVIIDIPSEILEKNLPGIVDGSYVGASLRVWEMLRDKYGKELAPDGSIVTQVVELADEEVSEENDRLEAADATVGEEEEEALP